MSNKLQTELITNKDYYLALPLPVGGQGQWLWFERGGVQVSPGLVY